VAVLASCPGKGAPPLAARAFPCLLALSVPYATRRSESPHKASGRFTYDASSPEVTTASIFDLASADAKSVGHYRHG